MHWLRKLTWRFGVILRKGHMEREMEEEIRYHLEQEIRENVRGASRSFVRRPGFTLTAVALIALGIGSTTTIFSVVDGVLLKALPYPDSEKLVYIDDGPHTYPDFLAFQESLTSLDGIAALSNDDANILGGERTIRASIAHVTPEFFSILGGRAIQGRLFSEEDFREDARLVVLDHGFWVRNWGGDPAIIGGQIRLDGEPMVVVGILDPAFRPPEAVTFPDLELWVLAQLSEVLNRTYLGTFTTLESWAICGLASQ